MPAINIKSNNNKINKQTILCAIQRQLHFFFALLLFKRTVLFFLLVYAKRTYASHSQHKHTRTTDERLSVAGINGSPFVNVNANAITGNLNEVRLMARISSSSSPLSLSGCKIHTHTRLTSDQTNTFICSIGIRKSPSGQMRIGSVEECAWSSPLVYTQNSAPVLSFTLIWLNCYGHTPAIVTFIKNSTQHTLIDAPAPAINDKRIRNNCEWQVAYSAHKNLEPFLSRMGNNIKCYGHSITPIDSRVTFNFVDI